MDLQQAKYILQSYRPRGQDASDPTFARALEEARRNPHLGRWFDAERALDAAISAKLNSIPVPPDLAAELLAAQAAPKQRYRWLRPSRLIASVMPLLLLLIGWEKNVPVGDIQPTASKTGASID